MNAYFHMILSLLLFHLPYERIQTLMSAIFENVKHLSLENILCGNWNTRNFMILVIFLELKKTKVGPNIKCATKVVKGIVKFKYFSLFIFYRTFLRALAIFSYCNTKLV